jgi:glycosyltransferase involved in cell wall biosynthesis
VGFFEDSPSGLTASDIQSWVDNGAIEFIGPLDDVRPALVQSSVFVLPSYYREGTPRAILEAMASGRPVITTDAPGCRETVVDGRNGFLVPARDIEALVAAMRYFVEQPDKVAVMGAESRRLAIDKYDVRKVTRSIIEAMQLGCTNA